MQRNNLLPVNRFCDILSFYDTVRFVISNRTTLEASPIPRETKFDAIKLLILMTEGKTAQQNMDYFGINKVTL